METLTLHDGPEPFAVSVHDAKACVPTVLFAVGAGGDPLRHGTLLAALTDAGCTVIAPHFQRLTSPMPTEAALLLRARRLQLALQTFAHPDAMVSGIGHSIGATTLLALAGGQMWLGPGVRIDIPQEPRIHRLAMLAPSTGFFRAPAALDAVRLPLLVWVGSEDAITPSAQSDWLVQTLRAAHPDQPLDLRITQGVGHFSFMDQPPPQASAPMHDKQAFLDETARVLTTFVVEAK